MAIYEENPWPPTGINLSAYKDLAEAADSSAEHEHCGLVLNLVCGWSC